VRVEPSPHAFVDPAQLDRVSALSGILNWNAWSSPGADAQFARHARASFAAQVDRIPPYAAWARHLGRTPERVARWEEIPAVPASAFKSHDLSSAPEGGEAAVFETSGTSISRPGRVRLATTRLYEASLLCSFRRHLLPDGARLPMLVFGPAREEAPSSSLWFMADRVGRELASGTENVLRDGEPRWEIADAALARAAGAGTPLLLFGTTLLFAAYFERCDARGLRFALPPGSRAMDTGGFKGARVDVDRSTVRAAFERVLGIPGAQLVNEYGMAELGSQFCEDALLAAHERREPEPGYAIPPWVRTRVLDPATLEECPDGAPGLLVHYDLANLDTPLAVQTEDVGRRIGGRLILHGRLPEAERRGCSLPFEEFLRRERDR
jgi:Acyl-protein synthetase, LuxE